MSEGTIAARLLVLVALFASSDSAKALPPRAPVPKAVADIRIDPGLDAPRAGETLNVSVRLLDVRGQPADDVVALDCDFGELVEVIRVGEGRYLARLKLPRVIPGTGSVLLLARAGPVFSEKMLPLAPAPPASIAVSGPAAVHADGDSIVGLHVTIRDVFGNASSAEPRVRAMVGKVGPTRGTGPGRWEVQYVPADLMEDREDVLTIEADPVRTTHALRLTARRTWLAFSPWSGVVRAGDGGTALALGAAAAWWWRVKLGALGILVDVAWWRLDDRTAVSLPEGDAQLAGDRSYVPVTTALAWGHRLGKRTEGWIALGGGAAWVATSQQLTGQPAIAEAGWGPAATATAAFGVRAWGGLPFIEARGVWVGDADLITVTGPVRAVLLLAGYRFDAR